MTREEKIEVARVSFDNTYADYRAADDELWSAYQAAYAYGATTVRHIEHEAAKVSYDLAEARYFAAQDNYCFVLDI